MSTKHTPGPWKLLPEEADKDYLRIRGTRLGGRYKVANVHQVRYEGMLAVIREHDDAESMGNALLIAAAPDLLDAAKAAWNCIAELAPTQARVEVAAAAAGRH